MRTRTIVVLAIASVFPACSGGSSAPVASPTPGSIGFAQLGPTGGFIPSIAFHPTSEGTVWASGDDGAGLYKSTDGGKTWAGVATGSQNQATYSLRFDPSNANAIFAPNHFGRGMLKSTDGGATWSASQAGLPISGTPTQSLNDLAIDPTSSTNVYAATDNGLYHSTDGGGSFSGVSPALSGVTGVSAVAFRQDGAFFIGKKDGAFGFWNGTSFTQLLGPRTPSAIPLSVIAFSSTSLYLAYADALIYRMDKNTFSGSTTINDPSGPGSIQNRNRLSLAVVSGSSGTTDTVYVGTMGQDGVPSSQWGLFKSTNGGGSWSPAMSGMTGNYIMSVAVDPQNPNNLVVGSGSGLGIYYSTNAGASWTQASTTGIYSTASLALAQDPSNPAHLLASNTACGGWSLNYETANGGVSWNHFADPVTNDGIFAFDVDPSNAQNVLAGTCTQGIIRSTGGTSGTWTNLTTTAGKRVDRFVRDKGNPTIVYAVVPDGDANHSLYISTTGGATFSAPDSILALNVAVHPTNAGEAIGLNYTDALATTDSFTTTHALGLSGYAPAEGVFTAAAFNPRNPKEVVVGGASGGLYRTLNYTPSGSGVTWTQLTSPISPSGVRDIVIVNRGGRAVYYAIATAPDTGVKPNSTQGIFRSLDGVTWVSISSSLFPSSMPWRMIPDAASPLAQFLIGMWSGGLFRLTDTQ